MSLADSLANLNETLSTVDRMPHYRYGVAGPIMARIRAKCIARYRLKGLPNYPDRLVQIGQEQQGMAISYGCFAIRVSLRHGRERLAFLDLNPEGGLTDAKVRRLFDVLDPHFGWSPRGYPIHGGQIPEQGSLIDPKLAYLSQDPKKEIW